MTKQKFLQQLFKREFISGKYKKEYAKVFRYYNKTLAKNPNSHDYYNSRAVLYEELGKYDKALLDYKKAIFLSPNEHAYYYNRGNMYGKLCDYEKALTDFNKAISLADKDGDNYLCRGEFYFKQYLRNKDDESLRQAYDDLTKAVEFDCMRMWSAYYWLSKYYEAVDNTEKQKEYYDKAIEAGFDESDLAD